MSNERRRQGPRGPMGRGMRGNGEKAKNIKEIICLFKTLLF